MENSIYIALSRQSVLSTNMNIIANNVANVNTPGFRGQNLIFSEYVSDPRGQKDPLSFVTDHGQYQVTTPGSVKQTGNPLDISLNGPGFIGVKQPNGDIAYTRAGNFQLGIDGELQTSAGYSVVDAGGAEITIPAQSTEINIDTRGRISDQTGAIGQIQITEFENIQEMIPLGNNLYQIDAAGKPAEGTVVTQGTLEGSNVNAILETTRMIDTLRSYQGIQKLIQSEHERLRSAIQKLTRG